MSITSLETIDLGRLSADARETLARIAPRMADHNDAKIVGDELGLSPKQVNDAMTALREEMQAQKDGATLPPLRTEDYEALRESIATYGQLTPILQDDRTGETIDGEHRLRACQELGVEPWIEAVRVDGRMREIALAANTVRRQLTPEQRRRIVTAELLYDPKASDRSIAAIAGVSHPTVAKVRAQLEKRGMERVSIRRDVTGRERQVADEQVLAVATEMEPDESGVITFAVSEAMVPELLLGWSPPVQVRLEKRDTSYELIVRRL